MDAIIRFKIAGAIAYISMAFVALVVAWMVKEECSRTQQSQD